MKKLVAFALLLASASQAQTPDSSISATYSPETPILGPWRAGGALQPYQDSALVPGQMILRRQSGEGTPQLFVGRVKPRAWEQASGFSFEVVNPWEAFRQARFFLGPRRGAPTSQVDELYYDGFTLMVAGKHDSLFMQLGDALYAFPSLQQAPSLLEITSWPLGAQVYLDGELRGQTPLQTAIIHSGNAWIRVEHEGHYTYETLVDLPTGKRRSIDLRLRPLPVFFNGAPVANHAYSALGTLDLDAARRALQNMLKKKGLRELSDIQSVRNLQEYSDTLTQRIYSHFFRPEVLRPMGDYDNEQQGLPVRMWVSDDEGFDFQFEGFLHCIPEEYPALRALLDSQANSETLKFSNRYRRLGFPGEPTRSAMDAWLRLSYRNWSVQARTQSRSVQRYYALEALHLVLPDRTYSISGLFVPPGYIRNTPEWKSLAAPLE